MLINWRVLIKMSFALVLALGKYRSHLQSYVCSSCVVLHQITMDRERTEHGGGQDMGRIGHGEDRTWTSQRNGNGIG